MPQPQTAVQPAKPSWLILRVGMIAGTLDIADALIFSGLRGVSPGKVFHYIASGLIGVRAFDMGFAATLIGVAVHYSIATGWTAIYYLLSRKFKVLVRRPVISGLLYGVVVYVIMNFIVLPMTGVPHATRPVSVASRVNGVLALMFCIGLTVALLLRRDAAARSEI